VQREPEQFDPIPLLTALADAEIDFVVIGGLAAAAHGSAIPTFDVDVMYERSKDNLAKLAEFLRAVEATLRGAPPGLPFRLDARTLAAGANFTFDTTLGKFDILADPAGARSYDRVKSDALSVDLDERNVLMAGIDDLIAMKVASGRPKDVAAAMELRALADEIRRSEAERKG